MALPARRPVRIASVNPALLVSRWAALDAERMPGRDGRLRPTDSCGPCGDARTGSRDRHACACAGGIRGPCAGDGCSAGTYACSRVISFDGLQGCTGRGSAVGLIGWHRSPTTRTSLFVDMRHRSTPGGREAYLPASTGQRYALGSERVKPPPDHLLRACGLRLAASPRGLLPSPSPSFPGTAGPPRSQPGCDARNSVSIPPLTCGNSDRGSTRVAPRAGSSRNRRTGTQPVDKAVD